MQSGPSAFVCPARFLFVGEDCWSYRLTGRAIDAAKEPGFAGVIRGVGRSSCVVAAQDAVGTQTVGLRTENIRTLFVVVFAADLERTSEHADRDPVMKPPMLVNWIAGCDTQVVDRAVAAYEQPP